jgi:copper(I)-binding protein
MYSFRHANGSNERGLRLGAALLAMWLTAAAVSAADFKAGPMVLRGPWARPTAPVASVGAVYFSLTNTGGAADRLLSIATPIAKQVQIHEIRTVQGSMQMRPLEALDCPPGATIRSEPGVLHVMLLGLQHPLVAGSEFPMTLRFRDAGELTVQVAVRAAQ